jgi:hypothetical protein
MAIFGINPMQKLVLAAWLHVWCQLKVGNYLIRS